MADSAALILRVNGICTQMLRTKRKNTARVYWLPMNLPMSIYTVVADAEQQHPVLEAKVHDPGVEQQAFECECARDGERVFEAQLGK